MRILLVEKYRSATASHVGDDRFLVTCAEDADEAMSLLRYETYDVVLLSMGAQTLDGLDLIRRMRASKYGTPLLALTGSRIDNRVKALGLGADDALADPVDPAELRARLTSILRRSRGFSQSLLRLGDLSLCLNAREARFRDRPVRLTPKEFAVLELLMLRKGTVLTKVTFLTNLYEGTNDEPEIKIIDVFICKLRKKLEDAGAGNLISTVWGHGYTIRDPNALARPASDSTMTAGQELAA
jgi:two-component system cell cycle response regulator CtrA